MISHIRFSVVALALCSLILSGCSEFRASRRIDLAPFGENTSVMVDDLKAGLSIKRAILVKPYLKGDTVDLFIKRKVLRRREI